MSDPWLQCSLIYFPCFLFFPFVVPQFIPLFCNPDVWRHRLFAPPFPEWRPRRGWSCLLPVNVSQTPAMKMTAATVKTFHRRRLQMRALITACALSLRNSQLFLTGAIPTRAMPIRYWKIFNSTEVHRRRLRQNQASRKPPIKKSRFRHIHLRRVAESRGFRHSDKRKGISVISFFFFRPLWSPHNYAALLKNSLWRADRRER